MTTYFISDLHLDEQSNQNSRRLLEFLRTVGPAADAIYILGDLFGLWVGDDLNQTYANPIITALKTLTNQGIPMFIMRGNRDFLLGAQFCQMTGCTMLADPSIINLYGQRVLLTHGDLLCTNDSGYQKYRKLVQNPVIKSFFLNLPIALRVKIANWVKSKSHRNSNYAHKIKPEIWDVNSKTVAVWLEKYQTNCMIHGHTHKPAIHKLDNATRIVLGDWNDSSAKILAFTAESFELRDLVI